MDTQLKRGLLDVCVLAAIKNADSYGYQIIKDMKPYTEVEKPRRNQTFITRSNSCDPTIRHHDRNTGVVALDAPIEKASGEV